MSASPPSSAGRPRPLPHLPGVITSRQVRQSGGYIAAQQQADGGIPWFAGEHLDPWDHVESAMALTVAGFAAEAARAYDYCAATQRPDGSWPTRVQDGVVTDATADTNQCAYLAVGVWHHWTVTGDARLLSRLWPAVRAAIDFALTAQRPGGDIAWAVDAAGPASESLLAGSSSIYQALRCACALAEALGVPAPDWELGAGQLRHALTAHRELFSDKSRYSMDWYYPSLAGAVVGEQARAEILRGWPTFLEPGWGVRCVSDHRWVTAAESSELALALDACGWRDRALRVLADIQRLRHQDGGYWTGHVIDDDAVWPQERTTWTAAAVILAADALSRCSPANGLFRGEGLGPAPSLAAVDCGCEAQART